MIVNLIVAAIGFQCDYNLYRISLLFIYVGFALEMFDSPKTRKLIYSKTLCRIGLHFWKYIPRKPKHESSYLSTLYDSHRECGNCKIVQIDSVVLNPDWVSNHKPDFKHVWITNGETKNENN